MLLLIGLLLKWRVLAEWKCRHIRIHDAGLSSKFLLHLVAHVDNLLALLNRHVMPVQRLLNSMRSLLFVV